MGHLETCCKHWRTWDLDQTFHRTSLSHSNYFFRYNQSYFIQACVPLPFVLAIESLQLNKTLRSVTCINCKLYTCLNSSTSLRNDSLLILWSHYNQSYFIQAYVPLPFIIAIGSLQFNKTLCSVTCINCKLYTCLNSSISLRNDSLFDSLIST